jgi:hypothetical protein
MTQPTYVTFEQAKKFKEKGLSAKSDKYWVMMTKDEYTEMSDVQLEDLDYSVGIGGNLVIIKYQQWQVVEWLRVNHGIWVEVNHCGTFNEFAFKICKLNNKNVKTEPHYISDYGKGWNVPQEAYSAAFDYVLNNLI